MGCCGDGGAETRRNVKKAPENKLIDPVERPDGSLLYVGAAPKKKGFVHDHKNPRRLILDSAPCVYRMVAPLLNSNGGMSTLCRCNNPICARRNQDVTLKICGECVFRPH